MAPAQPRLRVLSVGGNAVSAFLSWRLQATNLCDVTLVWKSNFQSVAQYGISFKSQRFGNERFKPRHVVQTPEDAAGQTAFDYVLLCVKALPDVYNLADIIESVVVPQHTCIIVNTTNTLGVEKQLEERFPTNVVLSLVSGADLSQLGTTEFEHRGSTEVWVGPANLESRIPFAIRKDMSEALAMTLNTAQVDCKVSDNIRKQQYERMIGPIAFHPISVLFETPVLSDLVVKPGVREMISGVIEELLKLARADKCDLSSDFKQKTFETMTQSTSDPSTMYQDFAARRPMEVETYLGAPCQLANAAGVQIPRLETLYAVLRHINATNKDKPSSQIPPILESTTPVLAAPPPPPTSRMSSLPPPRSSTGPPGPMNGHGRAMPVRPGHNNGPPPVRRGPPPVNGFRGPGPNGYPPRGPSQASRRPSVEDSGLDEFSHVVLYDDVPDSEALAGYGNSPAHVENPTVMRGRGGRMTSHRNYDYVDNDDDDEYYFDPMNGRGPPGPQMDAENFDMMSVTSRRAPRVPSQGQMRRNMYDDRGGGMMRPGSYSRPHMGGGRHRTSAQLMSDMPMLGENLLNNPMMGFSSNRYGNVDRKEMAVESRNNSLTASRLHEMGPGGGPFPPSSRRASRSPGNPLSPPGRMPGRPSPPHDPYMQGQSRMGRPSPPNGGMQPPMSRYPPGQVNGMHSHQIVQEAGVSKLHPSMPTKSLTGSASASAGSGDSGSANIESEPSAHSSTSSFAPRAMMSVR